jgi:hypothetical protein
MEINTRIKAEWDESKNIQEEFLGNYDAYAAYRKNEEAGNIKLFAPGRGQGSDTRATATGGREQYIEPKAEEPSDFEKTHRMIFDNDQGLQEEFGKIILSGILFHTRS